jgi:hypothetical protein
MEFIQDVNDIEIPHYSPSELYTKTLSSYQHETKIKDELKKWLHTSSCYEDDYWIGWISNTALNILRESGIFLENSNDVQYAVLASLILACQCSKNSNIDMCKYIMTFSENKQVNKWEKKLKRKSIYYAHQERLRRLV